MLILKTVKRHKKVLSKPSINQFRSSPSSRLTSVSLSFSDSLSLSSSPSHYVKNVQIWSFFWSVFSHIQTEYGEILRLSPYSVQMWENTDQKKLHIWTLFTQCHCLPHHLSHFHSIQHFHNCQYTCKDLCILTIISYIDNHHQTRSVNSCK